MTEQDHHSLGQLRAEIDRLDDSILELIERRLATADAIAARKEADDSRLLKIRRRREEEVVARLNRQAHHAQPDLIAHIWREIMSHSLQVQAPVQLVIAPTPEPALMEARVRAHFGSAAPVRWAASVSEALRLAQEEEAIAILPHPVTRPAGDLSIFDVITAKDGEPIAYAIGRVGHDDAASSVDALPAHLSRRRQDAAEQPAAAGWTPDSWRSHPAAQMPAYPDPDALTRVEGRLAGSNPLVSIQDIVHLRASLARVSAGKAFLLQGGDCAESFAEFGADKVRTTFNLLLEMGAMIRARSGTEVVHLARIAGQFAKPRSSDSETVGGVTLPSYRGDAVNGPAFTAASRVPDPRRLLDAHRQAQVTIELLHAYASASYADLAAIQSRVGLNEPARPVSMFTSHEALLLNYEQALTRFDEASESWYATSGHMIWIGDRTRQPDGAHVEFCRGVANPIGLKCGPSLDPDAMLRLMDRLDPENKPGRLVLIGRFGADKVADHLPRLMRATRDAGRNAIWSIDAMHGNTRSAGGLKTRMLADIVTEIETFFAVAEAEGVHAGGIHLEMTGGNVTECLGGSQPLSEADLPRRYLTTCDPRLNQQQALDVAAEVADLLAREAGLASNAA